MKFSDDDNNDFLSLDLRPEQIEVAPSEAELLALIAERIAEMLEREPEQLMSMLYRLDVEERKIRPVLAPGAPEPPHLGLARLVLERQKQRMATKRSIKPQALEGMDGWEW